MQSTPLNFVPNAAKVPPTPGQNPNARWSREAIEALFALPVSYTHLTLPTTCTPCRSRWSPYH